VKRALLAAVVVLGGCCDCSDNRRDVPRRPGDVVRDLRDAVTDHHWDRAALCFSEEVRSRNAGAMRTGEFAWPLAPGDTLVSVEIRGDEAIATLEPGRVGGVGVSPALSAGERDAHPTEKRVLVIQKSRNEWLVAAWR
jgi:hypothetical protein